MITIRRFIAIGIDYLLITFITAMVGENIVKNIPTIPRDLILACVMIIPFFIKDCLFRNQSIGKKICFIKVTLDNGETPSFKILCKRNCLTFFKLTNYIPNIIANNKSYGDIKCNTKVISKRTNGK